MSEPFLIIYNLYNTLLKDINDINSAIDHLYDAGYDNESAPVVHLIQRRKVLEQEKMKYDNMKVEVR